MKLSEYLSVHGQQTDLARAIGAQPQLVWQWAKGVRTVPIERCVPIERATEGAVSRRDLRPDDWRDIWPELEGLEPAPGASAAVTANDRRQHNNPPPPDLERREPIAAKLAGQGV